MPSALGLWGQPLACQGSSEKTLTTNLWPWQPPLSQSVCDSENVSCVSGDGIHAYLENHLENLWKPFSLPKKIWERERRGKAILFLARRQVCGDVVFDYHLKRIMNDPFSNSCQCFPSWNNLFSPICLTNCSTQNEEMNEQSSLCCETICHSLSIMLQVTNQNSVLMSA